MRWRWSAAWAGILGCIASAAMLAGCDGSSESGPKADGQASREPGTGVAAGSGIAQQQEQPADTGAGPGEVVTSVALPTGDRSTSLMLVEHFVPAPGHARAGEEFPYRIRLTNLSRTCALENIVVRQQLAGGMEVVTSDPPAAGREGNEEVWRLGPLDPGAAIEVRASGVVAAAGGADAPAGNEGGGACVRVSYSPALCAPLAVGPARAELVREAPETWTVCDLLPVRYRVTNLSDEPLGAVVIRERLAEGLVGGMGPPGSVEVRMPALGPRETREETVMVRALKPGRYEGRAVAQLEDGGRIVSAAAASTATQAALAVAVDAPEVTRAGDPMRYAVAVTNSGNGVAQGARVQVRTAAAAPGAARPLPPAPAATAGHTGDAGVRVLAPAGADLGDGFAVIPVGDIAPGATAYASFTLASSLPGELFATVEAVAPCSRAVNGERDAATGEERAITTVATRLIAATPITLDVNADPNPVGSGNEVVLQILVVNQSATPDRNVSVNIVMPPGLAVVEAMGQTDPRETRGQGEGQHPGGAAAGTGGTVLFEPLDRIQPGQRANWYIRATAREAGEYRVAVEVTSDGLPRPLAEIERIGVR